MCVFIGWGADLVEALGSLAEPYVADLVNDMFGAGLTEDLITSLHAIACHLPSDQVRGFWGGDFKQKCEVLLGFHCCVYETASFLFLETPILKRPP